MENSKLETILPSKSKESFCQTGRKLKSITCGKFAFDRSNIMLLKFDINIWRCRHIYIGNIFYLKKWLTVSPVLLKFLKFTYFNRSKIIFLNLISMFEDANALTRNTCNVFYRFWKIIYCTTLRNRSKIFFFEIWRCKFTLPRSTGNISILFEKMIDCSLYYHFYLCFKIHIFDRLKRIIVKC